MSFDSSRRASKTKKESIFREIGSGRFIAIRTIDELEDIISTSEAYMTDPTVIFNSDNTKVLFYYNTKGQNEIEEMETLFKRTVKKGSTITLSDAFYLDESSGDDNTYDLSGTYKFESYDESTKTIIAIPISINKQSDTNLRYDSRYWTGSLLWTTSDTVHTRTNSYEIINFLGSATEHSFETVFGNIKENDTIEVKGVGTYTVKQYKVDEDEEWERIVVKEQIPEKDLLGELTHIRILRSDRQQPTPKNSRTTNPLDIIKPPDSSLIKDPPRSMSSKISTYTKSQCDNDPNTHWMGSRNSGYCMEGARHQRSRSMPDAPVTVEGSSVTGSCCYFHKESQTWRCENKGSNGEINCRNHPLGEPPTKGKFCWQEGVLCRDRTDGCGCCCNNCESDNQDYNPKTDCLQKEPVSTTRRTTRTTRRTSRSAPPSLPSSPRMIMKKPQGY